MNNKLLLVLMCFFVTSNLYAQKNEGGVPFSISSPKLFDREVVFQKLPSVDLQRLKTEDYTNDQFNDIPWRFGENINVNFDLNNSGSWTVLPNGDKIWRLGVYSAGALTINLTFENYHLPPGAKLFIFNPENKDKLGAFTESNNRENGIFATSFVKGDKVVIEYIEPKSVSFKGTLKLYRVTHGYRTYNSSELDYGTSGDCNINVKCDEGIGWENEIKSVCMLVTGGNGFCSGALINNTTNDGNPYLLTANHCYSDPSSWVFWFDYQSETCDNPASEPPHQALSGASLKARKADSDFCLVELDDKPQDNDIDVYYAGWDRNIAAASSGAGIHHPDGDIKKISISNETFSSSGYYVSGDDHWQVTWSDGVTEGGSSGSPIFNSDRRIVGQLHGGPSACTSSQLWDYYGKFSLSWANATSSSERLNDWLAPDGSSVTTLDGWDPMSKIQNILANSLTINNLGTVNVEVRVAEAGDYYVGIWNKNGLLPPKWDWQEDYTPLSGNIGSEIYSLTAGQVFTFTFNVIPTSGQETFQFWLYRRESGIQFEKIHTLKKSLVANQSVEVSLSIDRSGSMSGNYLNAAKEASKSFVDLMQFNDYLAVTSFSNYADVNLPFIKISSDVVKTNAKNAINSITPYNLTSIGAGLQVAQNQLNAGNINASQGILLLSDGYQNVSPYVSQVLPNIRGNVDVYTIALGPNSDQNLLNNISASTGGFYSYAPNTQRLSMIYNSIRAKVTGQQTISSIMGQIAQGQTIINQVIIDAGTAFANFSLTWPGSDLDMTLTAPDGTLIDHDVTNPNISFTSGSTYETYGTYDPLPGIYIVSITGIDVTGLEDFNFVLLAESTLKMEAGFNKDLFGLNEPIIVKAELIDDELPVTGALVTVNIATPSQGDNSGKYTTMSEQQKAALHDKRDSQGMLLDANDGSSFEYDYSTLILYDDGQHGDGLSDDGIYSNYFTGTNTVGSYSFDVYASGTAPLSGEFTRQISKSTTVTNVQGITVTEPQMGSQLISQCLNTIRWSSTNINGNIDIYLSTNGGVSFNVPLALNITDDGSEALVIPGSLQSLTCRIKVSSVNNPSIYGINPGNFSVNPILDAGLISGTSVICAGQNDLVYTVAPISNASSYTWQYSGSGAIINGTSNTISINFAPDATSGILSVMATADCGGNGTPSPDFPIVVNHISVDPIPNQTVYFGYQPASCATLSCSEPSGGTPPYSYLWTTGESTQSITVCPESTTTYNVVITDGNSCTASELVKVCVIDVRCGNNLNKVQICHIPPGASNLYQTLCIAPSAVPAHLAHHDLLGACGIDRNCYDEKIIVAETRKIDQELVEIQLLAFPNPFRQTTTIEFACPEYGEVKISLVDLHGKLIKDILESCIEGKMTYSMEIDLHDIDKGLYFCILRHSSGESKVIKLISNN